MKLITKLKIIASICIIPFPLCAYLHGFHNVVIPVWIGSISFVLAFISAIIFIGLE